MLTWHKFLGLSFFVSACVYLILFQHFLFFGHYGFSNDYFFHFNKILGGCYEQVYSVSECGDYPNLYHSLLSFLLVSDESTYLSINLWLIFFLIPFLLLLKSNDFFTPLIYYSSMTPYYFIFAGTFAQALLTLWFVLFFLLDNFFFRFLLTIFAFLTHRSAVYVFIPLWVYHYVLKHYYHGQTFTKFNPQIFFYGFFDWWAVLINYLTLTPFFHYLMVFSLAYADFLLVLIYFMGAFLIANFRANLFIPVLLALWLPAYFKGFSDDFKVNLVLIYLISICFQILAFGLEFP
jgi:hypothetical protein